MNFRVSVLGAGTLVPTKKRNPSGFLVEVGRKKILLDAGFGIIRRLIDLGFNLQEIDLVFVSHFHTDHFADVFPLVHSRWVEDIYKNCSKHKKMIIVGPKGLRKRWRLWRKIFWVEPKEEYPVLFQEGKRKMSLGQSKISIFPVKHVRWFASVGIVIRYQGKKLVYTGDIGSKHSFKDLIKTCQDADLLITEASYEKPTPNHYTIKQVKKLAEKAKINKVLVVHTRPQHLERVRQVCKKEPAFIFAKEGARIKI